ncbi:MAG: hypothetical protein WKG00_33230 [Polyangiaceae bacterium]
MKCTWGGTQGKACAMSSPAIPASATVSPRDSGCPTSATGAERCVYWVTTPSP